MVGGNRWITMNIEALDFNHLERVLVWNVWSYEKKNIGLLSYIKHWDKYHHSQCEKKSQTKWLQQKCECVLNKAGYTATAVKCGWAGAVFEVTRPLGQEQWGQRNKIIKKVKRDRPTDRRTKRVVESRARDLKYFQPTQWILYARNDER